MQATKYKQTLHVIEGAQKGSRQPLLTASVQTVGTTFDCDIYLNATGEPACCLEILPGENSTGIMLRNGEAVLDSKVMDPGKRYRLATGMAVRLGSTLFVIEPIREIDTPEATAAESAHSVQEVTRGTTFMRQLHRPAFLISLIACGVVGSTIVTLNAEPSSAIVADSRDAPDDAAVAANGKSIDMHRVRNSQPPVVEDTNAATDIENSVHEIFRTHGLKADLSTLEEGRLVLRTSTPDVETLERAEAAANADVYGLIELNVINSKPPVPVTVTPPVLPAVDPGQTIRLIMVGNPSYVVTADNSRYFPGSQLPTGHRIKAIMKNKVLLQKNGVTTELLL